MLSVEGRRRGGGRERETGRFQTGKTGTSQNALRRCRREMGGSPGVGWWQMKTITSVLMPSKRIPHYSTLSPSGEVASNPGHCLLSFYGNTMLKGKKCLFSEHSKSKGAIRTAPEKPSGGFTESHPPGIRKLIRGEPPPIRGPALLLIGRRKTIPWQLALAGRSDVASSCKLVKLALPITASS